MAYEPRPGQGALFRNDRATSESHPSHKGYVIAHRNIAAGEKLDLAAWVKTGAKGKFFSLKLGDAYRKPNDAPQGPDDEIPF